LSGVNENELQAVIAILNSEHVLRKLMKRWDYIAAFLTSVLGASVHDNKEVS
jgi:hypothetical protein